MNKLWDRTDRSSGCWLWLGAVSSSGYGSIWVDGVPKSTHRLAYELAIGEIPDGMEVDHICFKPLCINPDHLRILPSKVNNKRQRSALKTHCVNGHEFTVENTYIRPYRYREGVRDCRQCIRDRVARYKARRRMAAA